MKLRLEKASESYLVGVLLAIAGGYLDVYTYICRGGVFANAQTGNIVLLGISMADQNWDKILFYIYGRNPDYRVCAEKIPLQSGTSLETDCYCYGISGAVGNCIYPLRRMRRSH